MTQKSKKIRVHENSGNSEQNKNSADSSSNAVDTVLSDPAMFEQMIKKCAPLLARAFRGEEEKKHQDAPKNQPRRDHQGHDHVLESMLNVATDHNIDKRLNALRLNSIVNGNIAAPVSTMPVPSEETVYRPACTMRTGQHGQSYDMLNKGSFNADQCIGVNEHDKYGIATSTQGQPDLSDESMILTFSDEFDNLISEGRRIVEQREANAGQPNMVIQVSQNQCAESPPPTREERAKQQADSMV